MPTILLVEKNGSIKELSSKTVNFDELYKKAGFKTADSFECANTWSEMIDGKLQIVSVYGKTKGRAGQENKYDLPPPIDNILFFGTCVLISKNELGEFIDLTKKKWSKIYEYLFGGFEDLDDDEDSEESEEDEILPRTKEGYAKDGFIVDDVVIEEEVEEEEEEEEEEEDDDEDEDEDEEDGIEEDEDEDVEEDEEEDEDDEEEEEELNMDENESDSEKKTKKLNKSIIKPTVVIKKLSTLISTKKTTIKSKKEQERISKLKPITNSDSNNYLNCSDELMEEEYV